MSKYYREKLSANRLQKVYEIAPPRVKQYLQAEIDFVLQRIASFRRVLELGCGYGRVLKPLCARVKIVTGIDNSRESLQLARQYLKNFSDYFLVEGNAAELPFGSRRFDAVICIQNGISAFRVDQRKLLAEAVRVTRHGGTVLFSSYSPRFWDARLEWFRIQTHHWLIGEIDDEATGNGVIVCKDGFRATTVTAEDFSLLTRELNLPSQITEVDASSVFCEIKVP